MAKYFSMCALACHCLCPEWPPHAWSMSGPYQMILNNSHPCTYYSIIILLCVIIFALYLFYFIFYVDLQPGSILAILHGQEPWSSGGTLSADLISSWGPDSPHVRRSLQDALPQRMHNGDIQVSNKINSQLGFHGVATSNQNFPLWPEYALY